MTIASGDRQLELELGAPPIEVSGTEGKARVSAKMKGPRLIVDTRNGRVERTTTYSTKGEDLSVEVSMNGSRLAAPVKYASTYVRGG